MCSPLPIDVKIGSSKNGNQYHKSCRIIKEKGLDDAVAFIYQIDNRPY